MQIVPSSSNYIYRNSQAFINDLHVFYFRECPECELAALFSFACLKDRSYTVLVYQSLTATDYLVHYSAYFAVGCPIQVFQHKHNVCFFFSHIPLKRPAGTADASVRRPPSPWGCLVSMTSLPLLHMFTRTIRVTLPSFSDGFLFGVYPRCEPRRRASTFPFAVWRQWHLHPFSKLCLSHSIAVDNPTQIGQRDVLACHTTTAPESLNPMQKHRGEW